MSRVGRFAERMQSLSNTSIATTSSIRFLSDLAIAASAFCMAVISSRVLGPAGRGELAVAVNIAGVVFLLGNLGLSSANIYFAARGSIPYSYLLGNSFIIAPLAGLLTTVVASAVVIQFPNLAGGSSRIIILIGLAFLPLIAVENCISYLIIGLQRLNANNFLNLLARGTSAIAFILSMLIWPSAMLAMVLIQTYSLARLVFNLLYMRRANLLEIPRLGGDALRRSVAYGLKSRGYEVFQTLNLRLDVLILNALSSPTSVGVYSVAVLVTEFMWYPSNSLGWVLVPRTAAVKDTSAGVEVALMVSRVAFAATIAIGLILSLLAWFAIPLVFGPSFTPARVAVLLLFPGSVMYPISITLSAALSGQGMPHYSSAIALISLVVTVTGDLLLIPRLDFYGASIASSIAYSTSGIAAAIIFARRNGTRPLACVILRSSDIDMIRAIILSGWRRLTLPAA
jgi:stage V sporulation protein B